MSTLVSEALAGLLEGLSDEASRSVADLTLDQMQAKHRKIIVEMIPKMQKIQREMRGRRFKVRCVEFILEPTEEGGETHQTS
jgi:predicted RNA-binding protein Jag